MKSINLFNKTTVALVVASTLVGYGVFGINVSQAQDAATKTESKKDDSKKDDSKKDAAGPKPALAVNVVKPVQIAMTKKLQSNGNVMAWQEAIIGADTNGLRLNEVLVNVGDVVKKGQLLASFSSESISADIAATQASVVEAEAALLEAKANAARARQIQESGALSQQQITQLLTAEQTSAARLQAVKAQMKVQQIRLKNTRVVSPDDGIISARVATVGAVVGAGQELFKLVRKSRLEWRAEVPSAELTSIRAGMDVDIQSAGQSVRGKVRMIGPTVDPQTRNGLVYVDIPNGSPIKGGMFASGAFELGSVQVLSVPQQALVVRDGFSYIFYVVSDRVTGLKIKTGRREGDRVEVLEGLKPDMQIVASGAAFLNNGDLVKVVK
jgi:RND family efflux transporter MFP subunit